MFEIWHKYSKNIEFRNGGADSIINEFKDDKNTFIFCDPPYQAENIYDYKVSFNIYETIIELNKNRPKALFMFVLGSNLFIDCFIKMYNLNVTFETKIAYKRRGSISRTIPYICLY